MSATERNRVVLTKDEHAALKARIADLEAQVDTAEGAMVELAEFVLSLADDAGMPDSFKSTDRRTVQAKVVLAILGPPN